jgi:hypothetical protein
MRSRPPQRRSYAAKLSRGALAAVGAAAVMCLAPASSYAQQPPPTATQPTAPSPGVYVLPAQPGQPPPSDSPQYTAPLYQQTQPSYVPQSVAMSGPRQINSWQEGDPIPPGYHPVERARKGLVIGGAVLFGVFWLISVLDAAGNADANQGQTNPAAAMYIPAAGPFIQMAHGVGSSTEGVLLAIDGIAQAAGVAMFIYGLASPKVLLVRNDLSRPKILPTPMLMGQGGSGLGVVGRF